MIPDDPQRALLRPDFTDPVKRTAPDSNTAERQAWICTWKIISYLTCVPNPTGIFFLLKRRAAVPRLLKGGLIPAGTGPAQLPATQPWAMLALPGHSITLSPLGSDISWWVAAWNTERGLLCVTELPALLAFEVFCPGFGFRRAFESLPMRDWKYFSNWQCCSKNKGHFFTTFSASWLPTFHMDYCRYMKGRDKGMHNTIAFPAWWAWKLMTVKT